ncbi:MAG: hypothetical protein ACI92N_002426 [Pseudomonadales bacterium]|jgi:hypothetical protein
MSAPNNRKHSELDFPHFSRHASITPQQEKNDAEDDYGEEDPTV